MKLRYMHTQRTHNEIVLGPKKGIPAIRENMDGSWGCYVKWNKSEKDEYCMI